jgi:YegS/Rv2252/BmrU family lipid kinase
MRHFALFVNVQAGKGKPLKVLPSVKQSLVQAGYTFEVITSNFPGILQSFTDIIIIGGDGTVNYIINRYPDISVPIGIVPAGSGNDLAFTLFPKSNLSEQVDNAIHGEARLIDAGLCNGRIFLNCLGIGFDGEVAREINSVKWLSGRLKYYWVVIKKILSYQSRDLEINWPGGIKEGRRFMVTAANGYRSGGGFKVAPEADWQDGFLELVIIDPLPVWKRFLFLPSIEKGTHLDLPFVESSKVTELIINSKQSVAGHLDGELIEGNSFKISVMYRRYKFRGLHNGG